MWPGAALLCALALLAAACAPRATSASAASIRSVRPVVKIGLIAPFEGLYRQSGYAALAAVRAAIDDCAPAGLDVLPLALDDSARPEAARRAAAKLLVDPAVAAVIGPLSLSTTAAVTPQLAIGPALWVAPVAAEASGRFASPADDPIWLADLIVAIAAAAQDQGAQSLAVAGIPPGWRASTADLLTHHTAPIPIRVLELDRGDSPDPGAQGALLWLGDAHAGARLLAELRALRPNAAFWMGDQGGDPIFAAHARVEGQVYWASWADAQYNSTLQALAPNAAAAFLAYDAACQALESLSGTLPTSPRPRSLHIYRVLPSGESQAAGSEAENK